MSASVRTETLRAVYLDGRLVGKYTNNQLYRLQAAINLALTENRHEHDWQEIISATCRIAGVSWNAIIGRRRTEPLCSARHTAMALIYERTGMSFNQVGALFGGRDHVTVMSALNKIRAWRGTSQGKLIRNVESALDYQTQATIAPLGNGDCARNANVDSGKRGTATVK